MTPEAFIKTARRLHGDNWKTALARDFDINVCSIHRMLKRPEIAAPYAIALQALLSARIEQNRIDKAVRKLLPRKRKKPNAAAKRRSKASRRRRARPEEPGPAGLLPTTNPENPTDDTCI